MSDKMLAAIRIRGMVGVDVNINKTLEMLRLNRKNVCVVMKDTPSIRGMLNKVKDYITWGEIDEETYKSLVEKRGEEYKGLLESKNIKYSDKYKEVDGKKIKPYFRLSPPKGGFERKGIKTSYIRGGALGYRKEKMKELIMRMI